MIRSKSTIKIYWSASLCPVGVAAVPSNSTSQLHTDTLFFLLHRHATVFQVPTSSPDPLRMRTTIPFLSCRQHSGRRLRGIQWKRGRERRERFEAVDCIFTTRKTSSVSRAAAGFEKDMVSRNLNDVHTPPRRRVSLCCLSADWRSLKGRASLIGASLSFYPPPSLKHTYCIYVCLAQCRGCSSRLRGRETTVLS